MKRTLILVLALLCLFSVVAMAEEAKIQVADSSLVIHCPAHGFANIVHPLDVKAQPKELMAQLRLKVEGAAGSSWAPGLCFYWQPGEWLMIRHASGVFRMEGYVGGAWKREDKAWDIKPSEGWNYLRLELKNSTIIISVSTDGDKWQELIGVPISGQGVPLLLVGKGFGGGTPPYTLPYLANAYSEPGEMGIITVKDIIVKADGHVILDEKFQGNTLNEEVWTPLVMGDPKLNDKIKALDDIQKKK